MDTHKMLDKMVMRGIVAQKITCEKTGKVLDVKSGVVVEINYVRGTCSFLAVTEQAWSDIQATVPAIEAHPLVSAIKVYHGRELFS